MITYKELEMIKQIFPRTDEKGKWVEPPGCILNVDKGDATLKRLAELLTTNGLAQTESRAGALAYITANKKPTD